MGHNDQAHLHGDPVRSDDLTSASKRGLTAVLVLIVGYMIVEVASGFLAGNLVLLAHAGYMLADAVSIGLALVVMSFSAQSATADRT